MEYLDITDYFQFSLVTTSMYRKYVPRMPAVMYSRYYQWLTDSYQPHHHHRFDLRALRRYSTYLQWSLARDSVTQTLVHDTTGFQLFTNDPSAPVTNSPSVLIEYFSRHRSIFDYKLFRIDEQSIYQSWSFLETSALPLVYNPVAARLVIDQDPIEMDIAIPAILIFANGNDTDLQVEYLSEWRCTTIHRHFFYEPDQPGVELIWFSRARPLRLLKMLFDREGYLDRLQTSSREYSASGGHHHYGSCRNEYRLTVGDHTTCTLVYAFYYPTLPKKVE